MSFGFGYLVITSLMVFPSGLCFAEEAALIQSEVSEEISREISLEVSSDEAPAVLVEEEKPVAEVSQEASVLVTPEGVSIQDVTRHFRDSQGLLKEATQIKSIERALRTLNKADAALKKAKDVLRERTPEGGAETRMKSRLMYKLDQDLEFLNQLRSDLGMAEMDSFETYILLRRSLIKDPEQRPKVILMDHQILLTLASRSFK